MSYTKATHIFFSKNISIYAIFNDQNFNNILTNNIVSFEQLSPDVEGHTFSQSIQPLAKDKTPDKLTIQIKNLSC